MIGIPHMTYTYTHTRMRKCDAHSIYLGISMVHSLPSPHQDPLPLILSFTFYQLPSFWL